MKYPYYNPNLSVSDALKSLFISKNSAEKVVKGYFSSITGKKYILLTNSCRTALYLSYKVLGIHDKEVITSPLTCKVAIDPIWASGNQPVFADIDLGDLNINPDDIESRITSKTSAIQVIHLGGIACKMDKIIRIAKKNNFYIIEDCAQSLGAKYNNYSTGSFGDIACFSLIKNAYGIGGGIFATNSLTFYEKAQQIANSFDLISNKLLLFRLIRKIIETYRTNFLGAFFYRMLMKIKGSKRGYDSVLSQLKVISSLEMKICTHQISRFQKYQTIRKKNGKTFYDFLLAKNLIFNKNYDPEISSFTKLFVYNDKIESYNSIANLRKKEIECMHLEHRHSSPIQEKFMSSTEAVNYNLYNYLKAHDSIISLPLHEKLKESDIEQITLEFQNSL